MSMEIIKQLYDIGNLLDMAGDVGIIKSTFFKFTEVELGYRNQTKLTTEDILEDIFQTALCISTRGDDGKGDFEQLQSGIQRLGRFIFSESYHLEKAIPHASRLPGTVDCDQSKDNRKVSKPGTGS